MNPMELPLDSIRQQGNGLKNEPSLYLQQHAHNPVYWHPWNQETLDLAAGLNRPIFLSSGYSSCHWCHVMETEVFEKDDVAGYLNEHFVCIKIDREERPDLDATYMEAVQLLTGRGGWPMSVFLMPDQKPFYGGTYFPRGPFLELLGKIEGAFRTRRADLQKQADQLAEGIARGGQALLGEGEGLNAAVLDGAVERAGELYDRENGGFQQAQKFPTPVKWRFLLREYRHRPRTDLRRMIVHSLRAMAQGGLYDHVGGGWHRYTVDPAWTVPHFEKMLYDNAQLASLMLEAGAALDEPQFTAAGRDTLDFLLREMTHEQGGLFASFDADSGGREGSYYVWNPAEIRQVVGDKDGPALAAVLGVEPGGNFESTGSSVITRRADLEQLAQELGRIRGNLAGLFPQHRPALREARDRRVAPGLDRKVVTAWNGLAIVALAQGFAATGEHAYLTAARDAADFLLLQHRRADGGLWRTSCEGRLAGEGVLDDYAFLIQGLIELFQVDGAPRYLQAARELTEHVLARFKRAEGGFYLSDDEVAAPLGRRVEYFDSVEPSGNAVMLDNLVRLGAITGEGRFPEQARRDLDSISDLLERMGLEMSAWCTAGRQLISPFYAVVMAGDDPEPARSLRRRLPANAVICQVPAAGVSEELAGLAPALAGKKAAEGGATTAHVCDFAACHEPTGDADQLQAMLGLG